MNQAYTLKMKLQIHFNYKVTELLLTRRVVEKEQEVKEKTHKFVSLNRITNL